MENKIGSWFGQALQHVTGLVPDMNAGAAPAPGRNGKPADGLDRTMAENAAGGALNDPTFKPTGDRGLDDQLLMARTAGPSAAGKPRPSTPTMSVEGHYSAGTHQSYVIRFDRPVSRAEADKLLFKDGKFPTEPMLVGNQTLQLGAVGKDKNGKSQEWVLSVPNKGGKYFDQMNPGIEDKLFGAARQVIPDWVPAGTLDVVNNRAIPQPGDPRFAQVKNHFPPPNDKVTTWRDGDTLFRYDAKTARLDGFRDKQGAEMGGYNKSMQSYVLDQGMSIDEAQARTAKDFNHYVYDGVLTLVLGSVG